MKTFVRILAVLAATLPPTVVLAQAGKPVIAIYRMDDAAKSGRGPALSTMIETAITATGKFRVIERDQLNPLLTEQTQAKAGLVTTNTPGKVGGFEGADYLVYGTITSVSTTSKSDFTSSLVAGLFTPQGSSMPSCSNNFATLGLDIKITDARTGEVRYVTHLDETQKSATSCRGPANDVDATALMRSAADKVAGGLVTTVYPIQVAQVQADGTVILNYGSGTVAPDSVMAIFSKGAPIIDPATGEVLANDEIKLGLIKIVSVTDRISRASPLGAMTGAVAVGSIVRPVTPAEAQAALKASAARR